MGSNAAIAVGVRVKALNRVRPSVRNAAYDDDMLRAE